MDTYEIVARPITLGEYREMLDAVGWTPFINLEAAEASLNHSLYQVVARLGDEIVGMGRVVGDGAIYFYIQDIAVKPAHQGRGLGHRIMVTIMEHLRAHAPPRAFIGLFAAEGTDAFYSRVGFTLPIGLTGMAYVIPLTQEG